VPDALALEISNLRYRYAGESERVVDIRSLRLAPGEQALLTGGSGSGKSTLLQLIAGLLELGGGHGEGEVRVAGTPMHSLHGAARDLFRGEHIGMIFQTFNLLGGFTAAENVMAALMFSRIPRRDHRKRAEGLLAHMGLREPGKLVDKLSVGQQQRVAVARAVACDPVLVLADEPTASLDPENAGTAIELIQQTCREKNAALLCVSHDPAMAALFPRRESLTALAGVA
jgi:putative ABC transport system ATP-binding protein